MKTLKNVAVGQTVTVKKLTGEGPRHFQASQGSPSPLPRCEEAFSSYLFRKIWLSEAFSHPER